MSNAVERGKPEFVWQFNWKICLFSLFFFPLLISLGVWQLERAEQKRTIQQQWQKQQALAPQVVASVEDLDFGQFEQGQFRKVQLRGQYDPDAIWLVENQFWHGQFGYHVVQAFQIDPKLAVLVNRGWIPGSPDRSEVPQVAGRDLPGLVSGQLVMPSVNRLLADQQSSTNWPKRILQIEPEVMSEHVGVNLSPWLLQIDEQDPAALNVQWHHNMVSTTQHHGYAFQWFAMAVALLILSVYANSNLHTYLRARLQR